MLFLSTICIGDICPIRFVGANPWDELQLIRECPTGGATMRLTFCAALLALQMSPGKCASRCLTPSFFDNSLGSATLFDGSESS
jgi:hypothetical protein